jgi:hypothetical protein
MKFNINLFNQEINEMISNGIEQIKKKNEEIHTMSICVDVNSQYSSLHFDTKEASDEFCGTEYRNFSPADFKYGDFTSIDNKSFEGNWECASGGKCWDETNPILKSICTKIIQNKIKNLNTHKDFILTCSGPNDWCEFEYQL